MVLAVLYGSRPEVPEDKIEETFKTIFLFAVFPSILAFYSFYFLIFPRIVTKKKMITTIGLGIVFCLVAGLVGYLGLYLKFGDTACLSGSTEEFDEPMDSVSITLFISFIASLSGIIALVMQGFFTWISEIKLKDELKQKNHETELALVKSQLDPHFLFNTINNIDVLIIKDQEVASEYLNKLSDIMRFMLFETKTDEISLSKEIEYIKKYIDLQRIRTANSAYVNFKIDGSTDGLSIAPMLFIPFIENAFKHTGNKKIKDAIDIQFKLSEGEIRMLCTNKLSKTDQKANNEVGGLGNGLIKRRLNLLYPHNHQLKVSITETSYHVDLQITKTEDL